MNEEWKKRIAIAYMVKKKLSEVDADNLWSLQFPELAASETEIAEAELAINHRLAPEFRQFLACANGWNQFYQRVDIFGTQDLLGSSRMQRALEIVQWLIEDGSWEGSPDELLPIGVSTEDNTLFCLTTESNPQKGRVLWFAGRLIDSFSDFDECFLAMCDYNRFEFRSLTKKHAEDGE